MDEPLLGLATIEQLMRELIVRFTVHYPHDSISQMKSIERALALSEMLGGLDAPIREYRTVDAG
jgi:hypothetical protein